MVENRSEEVSGDDEASSQSNEDSESESEVQKTAGDRSEKQPEEESDKEEDGDSSGDSESESDFEADSLQSPIAIATAPKGDCPAVGGTKLRAEPEPEKLQDVQVPTGVELNGDATPTGTESDSESEQSQPELPVCISEKASSKRPAHSDGNAAKESKMRKLNPESVQQKLFQRVFSRDDEVLLLEGLIEYSKKGVSDSQQSFYKFIHKSLSCVVSESQVQGKIRKMKSSFIRGKVSSGSRSFELSKQLWGEDLRIRKPIRKSKRISSMPEMNAIHDNIGEWSCMAKLSQIIEKQKHLISEEKKAEIEAMRKEVEVAEINLCLMKMDLIRKEAESILKAYNSL